ncbi:MAG: hypothetical protein HWE07_14600 [Cytophagia bacterium]|nr:hypothetical protein [Cytophagia bacterium]
MYSTASYQEPFWAKSAKYVRGRDPLGVQNSSISVYAVLLPGMTNLTLRLRYYGFYLWLLDEYDKLPSDSFFKSSTTNHYNFIRRGELIIAYLMTTKAPQEQSIIGSDYANRKKNEIIELGYYDLALGADKLSTTKKGSVYWDYTSGALGQYYAGSLLNLGLIDAKQRYFERTQNKGAELAQAFRESLNPEAERLFLQRILEGKLYSEDLDRLMAFAINKPLQGTAEGDFYEKLLLAPDQPDEELNTIKPPEQRKETLNLFLSYLNSEDEDLDYTELPYSLYKKQLLSGKFSEAQFGWYYYYLNEQVHYSLEAVFWGLLELMKSKTYSVQEFLGYVTFNTVAHEQLSHFSSQDKLSDVIVKLGEMESSVDDHIDSIPKAVKGSGEFSAITHGIIALLGLYLENEKNLLEVDQYARRYDLRTKYGNALEVFETYVIKSKQLTLYEFVSRLVHTLLNEHIAIAYNKMGNGEKNLLKFIIEDNLLIHIETMEPNFTNPRLRTLYNFSVDLGYLDKEGNLTEEGKSILNQTSIG